jgi:epoxyqueuosine reductase
MNYSNKISSAYVKNISFEFGTDLCGIASVDRFKNAPEGFHPQDVLPNCQSVVVLAGRFLKSTLFAKSSVPYTDVRNELSRKMDRMAIDLSYELEGKKYWLFPSTPLDRTNGIKKPIKKEGLYHSSMLRNLQGLGGSAKIRFLLIRITGT